MTTRHGPIYEVTLFVDREVAADCDRWLEDHVRDSLRLAAVADCHLFPIPDDAEGRAGRVCQHILATEEALDDFLDRGEIDSELAATFGEHVSASSRVLREDAMHDIPPGESPNCLNCGSRLRGQYCGHCGQRAKSRLISLWELISDAFGDLFELDSRLWQTLVPLVIRPGRLTHDYLQGRRARYMPPFRMYLVMSLIFFVVAFFDPREDLSLLFEPEAPGAVDGPAGDDASAPAATNEAERRRQEILDELAREGIIADAEQLPPSIADDLGSLRLQIGDGEDGDCDFDESSVAGLPNWMARRLTPERLREVCERANLDEGRALVDNLIDNIPAALIVLLPLMALVLKALYPLSRRYYVEHLLFVVHFHAFFFLLLTLQILFARVSTLLRLPESIVVLALVATSFYVPIYLFVAMRRVYGQGRFITFAKHFVLTIAYLIGIAITMLGALAIAAFSI